MKHPPLLAALLLACCADAGDRIEVTLDKSVRPADTTGRLIVFFLRTDVRVIRGEPRFAPFFNNPQPIASAAVGTVAADQPLVLGADAVWFDGPADALDGRYLVQAVLDVNTVDRGHNAPGNLVSEPVVVQFSPSSDEAVNLRLGVAIPEPELPQLPNLQWFEIRSPQLSAFHSREVKLKAAVVFPPRYQPDDPAGWGALYVIPGFGQTWRSGLSTADVLTDPGMWDSMPPCFHIILDPETSLGHHGFADSANNGPWGAALVEELIPALEAKFRLIPRPEGRLLHGHSSGAWSAMWLQLNRPDVFGGCWASAPDPIDFSAFQTVDLYRDANAFVDEKGQPRPSYRVNLPEAEQVLMTIRQEVGMEHAIDPNGLSGEQWATYDAMFSPRDESTGRPKRLLDPLTGEIHRDVAQAWARYDMGKLVASDWPRYGPIVREKIHLACGGLDSFYLNRAVEKFKVSVEALQAKQPLDGPGKGSIWLHPTAAHGDMGDRASFKWVDEWIVHFKALRQAGH
jgi:hypothetical protein